MSEPSNIRYSKIIINNDLRTMSIPSDLRILGVESDDSVNTIDFQMPRYYEGIDLSTFRIRVNYVNANGDGDAYFVESPTVDDSNIMFSWLVGRNACAYKGKVSFIVCLKDVDEEGTVVREFNTTIHRLNVLEGLETLEAATIEYTDVIAELLSRVNGIIGSVNTAVEAANEAAVNAGMYSGEALDSATEAANSALAAADSAAAASESEIRVDLDLQDLAGSLILTAVDDGEGNVTLSIGLNA